MTKNTWLISLAAIGLTLVLIGSSVFTVEQSHKAVKFRLGRIVHTDYAPGLHFKLPFFEYAKNYDGRIAILDMPPERFLTAEKKNVIVDALVQWRVEDVTRFYTAVQGSATQTNLRLAQILKDTMRGEFGRRNIRDLVSEDRSKLRNVLIAEAREPAAQLGVQLVDIRIKRIDLPKEVSSSVYRRMEAERSRVAKELRSQGAEQAEKIRAQADKQRQVLMAEAFRQAESLRGQGDAQATEIYARAYGEDPDFFTFQKHIQAYRKGLTQPGNVLVLKPDSPFFKDFAQDE